MRLMSLRISGSIPGRPPLVRLRQAQSLRNPAQCYFTTVAGLTMISASLQLRHRRESSTQTWWRLVIDSCVVVQKRDVESHTRNPWRLRRKFHPEVKILLQRAVLSVLLRRPTWSCAARLAGSDARSKSVIKSCSSGHSERVCRKACAWPRAFGGSSRRRGLLAIA